MRKAVRVTKRRGAARGFPLVEFSGARNGAGGLVEFHEDEKGDVHVTLYRIDKGVKVVVSLDEGSSVEVVR